jgi:AAA domain
MEFWLSYNRMVVVFKVCEFGPFRDSKMFAIPRSKNTCMRTRSPQFAEPLAPLETVLGEISRFQESGARRHLVVTGRSGIGKSSLLAAVADAEFECVRLVTRSPFAFTTFADWMRSVGQAFGLDQVENMTPAEIEDRLEHPSRNRRSVIIFEGLDRLLGTIGIDGQTQLSDFLNRATRVLLLASAHVPVSDLIPTKKTAAQFLTVELNDLTLEDVSHRFELNSANGILTTRQQGRIKALYELVGGLPRHWKYLQQIDAINPSQPIGNMLAVFLENITPLLNSDVDSLAAAKAKLLVTLATSKDGAPQTVTELSKLMGSTNQSTAKLLGDLERLGHVHIVEIPGQDRRFSYYEATDRLLVLSPICRPKVEAENVARIIECWYSTAHHEAARHKLIETATPPRPLDESQQELINQYNTAIADIPTDSFGNTINAAARYRTSTHCGDGLETKIRATLRTAIRSLISTWTGENWEDACRHDLGTIESFARPDLVAAMFAASTLDPRWIQAAFAAGYEPDIIGILHGYIGQPKMLRLACTLIEHMLPDQATKAIRLIATALTADDREMTAALLPKELRELLQQTA